jgi:hypothetical protein
VVELLYGWVREEEDEVPGVVSVNEVLVVAKLEVEATELAFDTNEPEDDDRPEVEDPSEPVVDAVTVVEPVAVVSKVDELDVNEEEIPVPELRDVVLDTVAVVADSPVETVPLETSELVQMYLVEVQFKGGAE